MSKKTKTTNAQTPSLEEFTQFYLPFALSMTRKYGSIENYLRQNPALASLVSKHNLPQNNEAINTWLEQQFGIAPTLAQLSRNKLLDLCDKTAEEECKLSGHKSDSCEDEL